MEEIERRIEFLEKEIQFIKGVIARIERDLFKIVLKEPPE